MHRLQTFNDSTPGIDGRADIIGFSSAGVYELRALRMS
jgi:hypothetical protein